MRIYPQVKKTKKENQDGRLIYHSLDCSDANDNYQFNKHTKISKNEQYT